MSPEGRCGDSVGIRHFISTSERVHSFHFPSCMVPYEVESVKMKSFHVPQSMVPCEPFHIPQRMVPYKAESVKMKPFIIYRHGAETELPAKGAADTQGRSALLRLAVHAGSEPSVPSRFWIEILGLFPPSASQCVGGSGREEPPWRGGCALDTVIP